MTVRIADWIPVFAGMTAWRIPTLCYVAVGLLDFPSISLINIAPSMIGGMPRARQMIAVTTATQ